MAIMGGMGWGIIMGGASIIWGMGSMGVIRGWAILLSPAEIDLCLGFLSGLIASKAASHFRPGL